MADMRSLACAGQTSSDIFYGRIEFRIAPTHRKGICLHSRGPRFRKCQDRYEHYRYRRQVDASC